MKAARAAISLCAFAFACDVAPPTSRDGPRLVATSATAGDRGFAEFALAEPVSLWFDQPLWPRSVNRATVTLQTGGISLTPRLRYEPVQHAIRVWVDPAEVRTDLEYELAVRAGITSWDGRVARAQATFRVRFVRRPPVAARPPSLRSEVAPLLRARCASGPCHGATQPVMGLDLSSAEAIVRSSVGVSSRLWSGSGGGGDFYWSGMSLVEPGAPGESFLLYKLLGDGPVRGGLMPRGAAPLDGASLQLVSDWIADGARDDR